MNKILILLISLLSLIGCRPITERESTKVITSKTTENKPSGSEITLLTQYRISSGILYIYKFGNDTIYLVEGRTSSYPVTMHVK